MYSRGPPQTHLAKKSKLLLKVKKKELKHYTVLTLKNLSFLTVKKIHVYLNRKMQMISRLFSDELITTSLPHTESCLCTVYSVYYNYLLLKYVILDSVLTYGNFSRRKSACIPVEPKSCRADDF